MRDRRTHHSTRRLLAGLALALALAACGRDSRDASPASTTNAPEPFTDITQAAGIQFTHFNGMSGQYYLAEITGAGVALLDYNNDGKYDILVLQGTPLGAGEFPNAPKDACAARLYRNDL